MGSFIQLAFVLAIACELQPPLFADLLVVSEYPGPGVDAVGVEAAVALAADGDTLLLREGLYGEALLDGKGLLLLADHGASVRLQQVAILNLPAHGTAALKGLELGWDPPGFAFYARDNLGSIWVDDCDIRGGLAAYSDGLWGTAAVWNCSSVIFNRCSLIGSDAGPNMSIGGLGLAVVSSSVYLFDTVAVGGGAGQPPAYEPGTGIFASSGYLYVSGGAIRGGTGQNAQGVEGPCRNGGDGAPGLFSYSESPTIVLVDVDVSGGDGGLAAAPCPAGDEGALALLLSGELSETGFSARSMAANSPVHGGEELVFSFGGVAGDLVYLAYSISTTTTDYPLMDSHYSPLAGGPLLMGSDWSRSVPVGTIPAAGTLEVTYPTFPITVESATLYTQSVALSPGDGGLNHFGSGALVTILGPGL